MNECTDAGCEKSHADKERRVLDAQTESTRDDQRRGDDAHKHSQNVLHSKQNDLKDAQLGLDGVKLSFPPLPRLRAHRYSGSSPLDLFRFFQNAPELEKLVGVLCHELDLTS